ncbi:unnamed protein product [Phytophthora fragariaefolia]|uniref:Unnamed protein product n=1 Tax=Phytophthora fragariaefolia TaxID=1490495 RepID=A0A9W6WWT1_9STRA|nr:unnamed protein product [Phytophthora fragariaefolia]
MQNYVKAWRKINKLDAVVPVLEICRRSRYDLIAGERSREDLVVFCDSKIEHGVAEPVLGTGSVARPFRIGLTSILLVERYVDVLRNPDLHTLLHLYNTHSIMKQKYPVFVIGISDRTGGFLPVVYYRTSQRKEIDSSWCLSFLKRVVLQEFRVVISPDFVMIDADTAQYNACVDEVPDSIILMCWFHVTQNVFKHARDAKLDRVSIPVIFRKQYDLHFAVDDEQYLRKRDYIIASLRGAGEVCPRFKCVANHIIKMWLLNPRFSRWQAYHTPPGYAATNNPLETYHYTLKLVNDSKNATPTELVSRLDLSLIAYESSMTRFCVHAKCPSD